MTFSHSKIYPLSCPTLERERESRLSLGSSTFLQQDYMEFVTRTYTFEGDEAATDEPFLLQRRRNSLSLL